MKKREIIYVPNTLKGECTFSGEPIADRKSLDILGLEGVKEIHDKLHSIVEFKKEIYGSKIENYGLFYFQAFYDLVSRVQISVYQLLDDSEENPPYYLEIEDEGFFYTLKNKKVSDNIVRKTIKLYDEHHYQDILNYLPRGEKSVYPLKNQRKN